MLMDLVSETIEAIITEIVLASQNVLVDKKSFAQLSSYLEHIVPLLRELSANNNHRITAASEPLASFLETLSHETKEARKLITDCSERNRFYLFVNCRSIAKHIERITQEISRAISCIPFASLNISLTVRNDLDELIARMQNAEFKAAVEKEQILDKIEIGINERNVDRAYANNLLVSIARAIGVPTDRDALKKELDEFKGEIENLSSRKDKAEAIQMEQIIALLERADVASSLEDREKKYLTKRKSLGALPLEPLTSFYCPITKEVMVDPVETPSGHTFEREAIEKWLSGGNRPFCPLTSEPLDVSMLRPNKTLRQSIEEWKERNTMIVVGSLRSRLLSGVEDEVVRSLELVEGLCEEREIHREWLVLENYIPCLVDLLRDKNREIKNRALRVLCLLAKDNVDAKERIANIENSISLIVRFLGRRIEESKLAVTLLLELSKCENMRECIGKAKGCIILLVTMLGNMDLQAARYAKNVLDSLSYSDENVIQMAKSNYFQYLLERLSSGSDHVKMTMAKTLGEMELTDHNKSSLVENGVLDLLLVLVPHDNVEMKIAAVEALMNLSSLKKNGQEMLKKGAVCPLLDILYRQTSPQKLRELVAATIVNLAQSTVPEGSDSVPPLCMFESDDDISELFSFINLAGPALQQNILQAFRAMCLSPCAAVVKSKLREGSAVEILFRLYEVDDVTLRANAVNLLSCLTEDVDEPTITAHITQTSIETLLKIFKTSEDEDEIASSLGIIANLPETSQISDWLLKSPNLPAIFNFLCDGQNSIHQRHHVVENAIGAISRLTVETSVQLQKKVAEAGVIPFLVNSLESGTDLMIKRASVSLTRLSRSSPRLSRQISRRNGSFWCFSALPESSCPVHRGLCTIQSSFCLIEANAVGSLIRVLGKQDPFVCEAGLDALLTLIDDVMLQNGCKVLDEENAMPAMIKLIASPCVVLQEKVLNAFERIFRLVEYKHKYGKLAQAPLVDLTQRGSRSLRSLAARLLGQLNVLHDQSSYF
ncbi:U-box domain-containing protein 43 [Phtheirospermum japonicum]|uniref:RING-type E3 ubiquitin transferase n=1 Tax=Phtheirospermum japonicum TaxID=374723 RepID=A0A830BQ56_9LAMI|nr:U-box domain-containing protein 43 [Phtheirospermum japonicum]